MENSTKKCRLASKKVAASERIHNMFRNAPVIVVRYFKSFAQGYCVWSDGVEEHVRIDYDDLAPESQHDRAMAYIKTII